MKYINNVTMESNILDQLAAFDIRAKIDVSIDFEDSDEAKDVTVKKENSTDDDNSDSQDKTNLPQSCLEPQKQMKKELVETAVKNIDDKVDYVEHVNNTDNSDDKRKRKQKLLQIYKNKRAKIESPQENVLKCSLNPNKENDAHISLISNFNFTHQDVDTSLVDLNKEPSAANIQTSNSNNEERNKIQSGILNYLTDVSENMRLVMEAHAYHRQYNSPYESFKKQKYLYFGNCYNTVVILILPKTQNKKFMLGFLHKTYQHALKRPALRRYSLGDYNTLLKELLDWTKKELDLREKIKTTYQMGGQIENSVQPSLASSNFSQSLILESSHSKLEVNRNTKSDTICIFSAGPPGNEIRINVDPKSPFQTHPEFQSTNLQNNDGLVAQTRKKSSVDLPPARGSFQTYPDTRPNNTNNNEASLAQSIGKSSVDLLQAQGSFQTYPDTRPNNINNNEAPVAQSTRNSSVDLPRAQVSFQTYPDTRPNNIHNNEAPMAQSSKKSSADLPRVQVPFQTQPGAEANKEATCLQKLLQQAPQILPNVPDMSNLLIPEMYNYMQTTTCVVQKYLANDNPIPKQINKSTRLPQKPLEIQNGNTVIGQSQPKSMLPPWMLHQNQQAVNTAPKQMIRPPPPSYDQLIHLPPPMHISPIWSEVQQQHQVQPEHVNYQHIQPHHDHSRQIQQLNQIQLNNVQPQYGQFQHSQSQIIQTQNILPQNGQVPTRQSQLIMSQHVSPQIPLQSPAQTECENRLRVEEVEGLNYLYRQGQIQQQSHKNAPRSTSTDSGFISPLNFNPSDQMVPPVTDHTESSQIVITHVTSLNPNVPSMAEGSCVMCKTTTKKVCMGCMKVYYCTYDCQLLDWPKHGSYCQS